MGTAKQPLRNCFLMDEREEDPRSEERGLGAPALLRKVCPSRSAAGQQQDKQGGGEAGERIRYLVQPKGALRIIEENQSLVTETNYPLAAVQIWQSKQLFAEHGRQASSGKTQREPAMRDDGFLSPRCHQLGQHWTELR
ncbi:hypothetical protein EYF80_019425 [Liparis tanakae]|uniref:Uncharacterized protein n=1 Tax=Liparis tanakae TaxID=230148 RepID=A0A4Z2HX37_9TELE|nr:hypothetical protein EYF80_019425 [Liparis tanakae]